MSVERTGRFGCAILGVMLLVFLGPAAGRGEGGEPVVVRMLDQGFVPNAIEVWQGDSVVFENRGKEPHWPASDIHPTHQVYPELDARQPVVSGQRWTFRFDRPGAWRFHDHLHPEAFGSVVVRERPGGVWQAWDTRVVWPITRALGTGYDTLLLSVSRFYYRLFPDELERVLRGFQIRRIAANDDELRYWVALVGSERIMAILLDQSGGWATFDCHQEAHQVGRISYTVYGLAAFRRADATCASGFYHGALEGFLRERGTTNFAEELERLCQGFQTRYARMQCLHGAGHGVMAYEAYDLPKALHTCGTLGNLYARRPCYDGVFMENIVVAMGFGALRGHRTAWVSQDFHFPCSAIGDDPVLLFHCYQIQTTWMLSLTRDYDVVVRECSRALGNMQGVCFKSLGRDIASVTLRDPQAILALCAKVPRERGDYHDRCVGGAVEAVVIFWGERLRGQASAVCRLLADPDKRACYDVIVGWLDWIFPEPARRREVCETFETGHRERCSDRVAAPVATGTGRGPS